MSCTEEIVIVHWPGKDVPACPKHRAQLVGVADVMGFPLSCTPAPDDAVCTNCENERRKS